MIVNNERCKRWLIGALVLAGLAQSTGIDPIFAKDAGGDAASISEATIDGKSYSVARVVVKASPRSVFRVLTDYERAHQVFPQVKECSVLKSNGNTRVVKHVVAPSGPVGTYTYVLKIEEKEPSRIEWTRISGAFKQVEGYYQLESLDNGRTTLVTYASHVDGGVLMPKSLIKRQCRIDMPQVMSQLKSEVESKIQIAGKP